ncbi:MmgE/PrpD family protein [Xylophilus sp. Kf1]|nr:MmgE/PrpD family protein [Xylophilus sp. Kf1]
MQKETVPPGGPTPTADLNDYLMSIAANGLDPTLAHHAKRHLIDTVGAILAGSGQAVTRQTAAVLAAAQPAGTHPVPGLPQRLGLLDAVFLTGVSAHGTETDDGYRQGSVHPGAVVVPALLSIAAQRRVSGDRLLEALAAGYQAIGSIAALAHPRLRRRGFHPTGAVGPLGAAAASSALLDLDRPRRLHALGIAASSAAGLFAFKAGGADVKRLHAGHAAREGVLATLLAQQGCEGPPGVLEASDGFLQAFADRMPGGAGSPDTVALPPEVPPTIADCYIKPYACCRHIQPAVDALQALMRDHAVEAGEIESVEVETYGIAADHAVVPWGSFAEAQLSFRYVMASAARFDDLRIERFGDAARADETTAALAHRMTVRRSDAMDRRYPAQRPALVTLHTRRGSWSQDAAEARGAPELPLDDAGLDAKFLDLAGMALGSQRAAELLARFWRIDTAADVSDLIGALSPLRAAIDPVPRPG